MSQDRIAILFDLDGTLVDSLPDVGAALNRTLARHGRPPITIAQLKAMVGEGARVMVEKAFMASGSPAPAPIAPVIEIYMDFYRQAPMQGSRIYPGTLAAVEQLVARGYRIGVCTNKPDTLAKIVLEQTGLQKYVCAMVGGNTPIRKPSAEHVHETLRRMSRSAPAAVLIGDSSHDILAAKAAGIYAIAVTWGYGTSDLRPLGADLVISHMDELAAAIAELERRLPPRTF